MKHYKRICMYLLVMITGLLFSGCTAMNNVTEGIKQKSISGSGTFIYSTAGLDAQTQTPELTNLFVWGDYTSVCAGDEVFRLEEIEDCSIFNPESKTKKRKVFFSSGNKERVDKVIESFTKKK